MKHYANCHADYPEKREGEPPQAIIEEFNEELGWTIKTCVDCGAFEIVESGGGADTRELYPHPL